MSNRLFRCLMFGLLCLSLAGITACGDDPQPSGGNNGPECTTNDQCADDQICEDGTCVDDAPACTEDGDCDSGEFCAEDGSCVSGCNEDGDCSGDLVCLDDNSCGCESDDQCGDGEVCENNACQPEAVQCESVGDPCGNSEAPMREGFVCLVTEEGAQEGECHRECDPAAEPTTCASGTYCAELTQPGTGACLPSECSGLGDIEGCSDEIAANPDAFPHGANCSPQGNDAFVCRAAGPLQEGDACHQGFAACQDGSDCPSGDGWTCETRVTQESGGLCLQGCATDSECGSGFTCESVGGGLNFCLPQTCGEGLACGFDAVCTPLCDGDATCGEDARCIGDDDGLAGQSGWGFCGNGCDAYGELGQCGEDLGCFPVSAEDGICTDVGPTPVNESCEVLTSCTSDADCTGDGSTCNEAQGVCQESCSTDADCSGEGTCDVPETADQGFCVQPAQCAEGSRCINLGNGEGRCMGVCDPTQSTQAAMDATCGQGNPTAYTRFLNLAQSEGAVDIYINGTLAEDNFGVDAGSTTALTRPFNAADTGDVTIEVVAGSATDNSSPLASTQTTLVLNDQKTFAIVDVSGGLDIVTVDDARNVAAPASGQGRLNLAMDASLATNVDAYIVEDTATFLGTESADFTDLAFGDVTDFTGDLAAGDYVIHLFEAGATPLVGATNALHSLDVTLSADSILTFHIWGTDTLGATAVEHDEGPETSNDGFCFDLSSDAPRVNSGICFERCTGPEAYGAGTCTTSADNCSPFRANHVCLPSENLAVGEACDPFALNACEAGAYCRRLGQANADGTPTGVCAKQCVPGGSANAVLGCPSAEACEPIGDASFNFGQCGFACEPTDVPTDYSSADCTEDFLMACAPVEPNSQAFCSPSNNVAVGDECGELSTNTCVPNALCRRTDTGVGFIDVLIDPVQGISGANNDGGTCQQRCELFTDGASGCPSGQECWIDGATLSPLTGYCMEAEPSLAGVGALNPCSAEHAGKMCDDATMCADIGDGSFACVEWCDTATGAGCEAGESCRQYAQGANLPVGLCFED